MVRKKKLPYHIALLAGVFSLSVIGLFLPAYIQAQEGFDWRSDWAASRGYTVSIDSQGYQLPSAIAFVPRPGDAPTDPLYFVLELKGAVKVVTNDRSVHIFAEDFFKLGRVSAFGTSDSLEVGLAGICLDPKRGYVFVTFAFQDSRGALRNSIVRFRSTPNTFSLLPESQVEFRDIFSSELSSASHQIGSCQVNKDLLYVSVGDGEQPNRSQRIDSTLGKVLRMTLDGEPVEHNPFYEDPDRGNPANYTWAYGLRNPFGLTIVKDLVFIADTGPRVDRFLVAKEGENYLWDGSDKSMGTKAISVLSPGKGLSRVDYNGDSQLGFPEGFFLNLSGSPAAAIPNEELPPQILYLDYDVDRGKLRNVPVPFVRYRGETTQVLAGLNFGPDGLYFTPLLPNQAGMSAVLKITRNTAQDYPFILEDDLNVRILLGERACTACHSTQKGVVGTAGPNLYPPSLVTRLEERLNSEAYAQVVQKVDELDDEPFVSFRAARHEILEAEGTEQVRLWIRNQVLEPKFDNPNAMMPNLELSEDEADAISDFFVSEVNGSDGILSTFTDLLPKQPGRLLLVAFTAGGFVAGIGFLFSLYLIIRAVVIVRGKRR